MKRKALLAFLTLLGLLLAFSWPTYHYPPNDELRLKANYLARIIRTPADQPSELTELGNENPEWALFSLSYSVYAFTNMAQLDSRFRPEAAECTELAIGKMLKGPILQAFRDPDVSEGADTISSVLYLGHLNLMLGCHRLLNPTSPHRGPSFAAAAQRLDGQPLPGILPAVGRVCAPAPERPAHGLAAFQTGHPAPAGRRAEGLSPGLEHFLSLPLRRGLCC